MTRTGTKGPALWEERRPFLTQAIIDLVREVAQEEIVPRFRALATGDVSDKGARLGDLVTIADQRAEARLTAAIHALWPEATVIGEEAVAANPALLAGIDDHEWAVIVDPVDGTWNFASGLAVFGVIIAVVHRGQTVWGMLYDPLMDDWVETGAGRGAHIVREGQSLALPARAGDAPETSQLFGFIPLYLFEPEIQTRLARHFPSFGRVQALHCSCHEYRLVAQGHVDFVIGQILYPWDHLAGTLAVTEAGGHAALLNGAAYRPSMPRGPLLVARSREIWDAVAAEIKPAFTPA